MSSQQSGGRIRSQVPYFICTAVLPLLPWPLHACVNTQLEETPVHTFRLRVSFGSPSSPIHRNIHQLPGVHSPLPAPNSWQPPSFLSLASWDPPPPPFKPCFIQQCVLQCGQQPWGRGPRWGEAKAGDPERAVSFLGGLVPLLSDGLPAKQCLIADPTGPRGLLPWPAANTWWIICAARGLSCGVSHFPS